MAGPFPAEHCRRRMSVGACTSFVRDADSACHPRKPTAILMGRRYAEDEDAHTASRPSLRTDRIATKLRGFLLERVSGRHGGFESWSESFATVRPDCDSNHGRNGVRIAVRPTAIHQLVVPLAVGANQGFLAVKAVTDDPEQRLQMIVSSGCRRF
jgi:hypothetical protein